MVKKAQPTLAVLSVFSLKNVPVATLGKTASFLLEKILDDRFHVFITDFISASCSFDQCFSTY